MITLGKNLVLFGIVIVVAGLLLLVAPKIPYIGKLPGDIHIKKENFEFYFPLTTSILISIVLSGFLWFISNLGKK
jgi:heme/copper-type cytochrome/quinol oxidase subunit 4